jgi:hypothetical protein
MNADFWELEKVPGYFAFYNDGARWLQDHKDDPYWMGHQLADAVATQNYNPYPYFLEFWQMAREIKGFQ